MMTIYTAVMCIGILFHNLPNFGARRPGWIAVAQFPLIFALAAKNNFVGFFLGVGYEKVRPFPCTV